MKNYFILTGTLAFFICASCVYSLTNSNNNIEKYNINFIGSLIPNQKIIYRKSNKELCIYKNHLDNNHLLIKYADTINYIELKQNGDDYKFVFDFEGESILNNDIFSSDVITLSPGGVYGFYDAGICTTIKKKYILDNYIFSGASAGAWNSLFMSYKYDINDLINSIFDIDTSNYLSINKLQMILKEKILNLHSSNEFDLKKVYITVCVYENMRFNNYIYTDFIDLEDAINCCMASSNIPFLTGNLIFRYNGKISFDGGFLSNQSFLFKKSLFNINHSLWGRKRFFSSLFDNVGNNIKELYNEGIQDTEKNIDIIDKHLFNDIIL